MTIFQLFSSYFPVKNSSTEIGKMEKQKNGNKWKKRRSRKKVEKSGSAGKPEDPENWKNDYASRRSKPETEWSRIPVKAKPIPITVSKTIKTVGPKGSLPPR